jgi:hypothetical protein
MGPFSLLAFGANRVKYQYDCNASGVKSRTGREVSFMGKCLKGESEAKKKDAKFECGKCGARTEKKSHVCKPEKLKSDKKK